MAAPSIPVKWLVAALGVLGVVAVGIWLTRPSPSPSAISPSPEDPGAAVEVTSPYRILLLDDPDGPTILMAGPLGDGARPVPGPLGRDAAIYPSPDGRRVLKVRRPGGTPEIRLASSPFDTFHLITDFEGQTFVADVLWAEDLLYVLGTQCPVCESFEKDPPADSEEGHLRLAEAPPNAYTFFEVDLTTQTQRVVGRAQRRPCECREVLGAIDRDRRRLYWYLWSNSGGNVVEDSLAYIDLDGGTDAPAFPIGMVGRPAFRPDGRGLYTVEGNPFPDQFELVEYGLPDGRRRVLAGSAKGFGEVTLDAVGGSLYAIVDGALARIDLSNGGSETLVDDGGSLQVESLSPDGRFLWLSGSGQSVYRVFDLETQVMHTTPVPYHGYGVIGWVRPSNT